MDILVKVCQAHYPIIKTEKNGFIKWGLYDNNFKMFYYRVDRVMRKFKPHDFVYFYMNKSVRYFAECEHIQETIFPKGIIINFEVVMHADHMKQYQLDREIFGARAIYFDDGMKQLKEHLTKEGEKEILL